MKTNRPFVITSILLLFVFGAVTVNAGEKTWFTRKDEGWFFYKTKPLPPKELPEPEKQPDISSKSADTKTEAVKIRELGETLLGNAMVRPTEENVKTYMEYQKRMTDGANQFAQVWERVLAKNPNLYLASHYSEQVVGDMDQEIKKLARKTGIFFFFSSTCPHCHNQVAAIMELQREYGFQVLGISLDGGDMPQLNGMTTVDNGISENLGITTVPAIYLAYPEDNKFEVISQGYLPVNDIKRRLYHYAQLESGTDPVGLTDILNRYSSH